MSADSMGWKIVGLGVALLTLAVPTYVAYDLYDRGPTPEKRIELRRLGTIDALKDLSALGDKVTLSLKVEDQILDNIIVAQAIFVNVGRAPILPSDYHQNLSVSVSQPWKIIAVENSPESSLWSLSTVALRWSRFSDTKFEAEPALLNPGDMVDVTVYITNTRCKLRSRRSGTEASAHDVRRGGCSGSTENQMGCTHN